jgi:biopolymer transport protein ExbD
MADFSDDSGNIEPDLTPLLDMVLQLLMFFVISVNFKTAHFKFGVQLPVAQSAMPFESTDSSDLIINLRPYRPGDLDPNETGLSVQEHEYRQRVREKFQAGDGMARVPRVDYDMRIIELKFWLKEQYEFLKREAGGDANKVVSTIILRADVSTNYEDVYNVMNLSKLAGFRRIKYGVIYDRQ